jgi:hypothetical protein
MELPAFDILESRYLLAGADAAPQDRLLVLAIVGLLLDVRFLLKQLHIVSPASPSSQSAS